MNLKYISNYVLSCYTAVCKVKMIEVVSPFEMQGKLQNKE